MPDIFISGPKEKKLETKDSELPEIKKPPKTEVQKEKISGHTHNPLAAFSFYPDGIDFETREKEEKVILLLRKHLITNVGWISLSIILILAPMALRSLPFLDFLPPNFAFIAILGWYLITIAYILESFLTWFFNVYIVTDERIVDIDFYNLIYKEVSDTKIDRIQDVTYKMGGVIRTLFNYGDVYIQTAAEVPAFEFMAVPKPDRVAKILQDLILEEEQEKIEGRVR